MSDARCTLSPKRVKVHPAFRPENLCPSMPAESIPYLWELNETKGEARGETDSAGESDEEGAVLIAVTDALSKDPPRVRGAAPRPRSKMHA